MQACVASLGQHIIQHIISYRSLMVGDRRISTTGVGTLNDKAIHICNFIDTDRKFCFYSGILKTRQPQTTVKDFSLANLWQLSEVALYVIDFLLNLVMKVYLWAIKAQVTAIQIFHSVESIFCHYIEKIFNQKKHHNLY